ncbi:sortase domain-containing protein [Streptomyces decoyicus]|uniref:sortase domain-containing protein n=1 Tax=Streptomyces decoyicus TaxID=249567 RepID=UPI00365BD0BF
MNAEDQGRAEAAVGVPALSGVGGGSGVRSRDGVRSGGGARGADGVRGPDGVRGTAAVPAASVVSGTSGTSGMLALPEPPHTSGSHGHHAPHGPLTPHSTFTPLAHPDTRISPGHTRTHVPTPARLLAGVAWAVLLLGLWLWGRDLAEGVAAQLATTGDVAAVGRPLGRQTPPHAHAPVPTAVAARPVGITIGALGVREAAITERGLDEHGILTPPPDNSPSPVGWYAAGPQPGEEGTALLVGRAGTGTGHDPHAQGAVVHRLAGIKPGEWLDIQRSDGSTARFTVEDVQLYDRERFDARKAYAARDRGRSELRLIVEGGSRTRATDRSRGGASNVVVVSAYLTSLQPADARDGRTTTTVIRQAP